MALPLFGFDNGGILSYAFPHFHTLISPATGDRFSGYVCELPVVPVPTKSHRLLANHHDETDTIIQAVPFLAAESSSVR